MPEGVIEREGSGLRIHPVGKKSEISVNGTKIKKATAAADGDVLTIGGAETVFKSAEVLPEKASLRGVRLALRSRSRNSSSGSLFGSRLTIILKMIQKAIIMIGTVNRRCDPYFRYRGIKCSFKCFRANIKRGWQE